jgi:hypothetical protein
MSYIVKNENTNSIQVFISSMNTNVGGGGKVKKIVTIKHEKRGPPRFFDIPKYPLKLFG